MSQYTSSLHKIIIFACLKRNSLLRKTGQYERCLNEFAETNKQLILYLTIQPK